MPFPQLVEEGKERDAKLSGEEARKNVQRKVKSLQNSVNDNFP